MIGPRDALFSPWEHMQHYLLHNFGVIVSARPEIQECLIDWERKKLWILIDQMAKSGSPMFIPSDSQDYFSVALQLSTISSSSCVICLLYLGGLTTFTLQNFLPSITWDLYVRTYSMLQRLCSAHSLWNPKWHLPLKDILEQSPSKTECEAAMWCGY